MGFDYFYGLMGGETDQWTPFLFQNNKRIFPWIGKPGYNLITDMADDAIRYNNELKCTSTDKPFFLYYFPRGSLSPHPPQGEWCENFSRNIHMLLEPHHDKIFAYHKRIVWT